MRECVLFASRVSSRSQKVALFVIWTDEQIGEECCLSVWLQFLLLLSTFSKLRLADEQVAFCGAAKVARLLIVAAIFSRRVAHLAEAHDAAAAQNDISVASARCGQQVVCRVGRPKLKSRRTRGGGAEEKSLSLSFAGRPDEEAVGDLDAPTSCVVFIANCFAFRAKLGARSLAVVVVAATAQTFIATRLGKFEC